MFADAKLYEQAYDEAVQHNEKATAEIEEFKKELEGVKQNLEENQKHLFQRIMVPLAGKKAFMKAKLIHTNEVTVFLGDKWFVRTSAARAIEICNRKIERCNENLAEIEQQVNRFNSNIEKAQEYEIFPNENLQDIVEPFDEEAETLWREKHKEKIREHKKQEAAERNRQKNEDLFTKLEALARENADAESEYSDENTDDSSDDSDDSPQTESNSDLTTSVQNVNTNRSSKLDEIPNSVHCDVEILPARFEKKRVSFSDSDELKCYSPSESVDAVDTNIVLFKHNNRVASHQLSNNNEINTPSDIHRILMRDFNPKSILKKENLFPAKEKNQSDIGNITIKERNTTRDRETFTEFRDNRIQVVIGDIIERTSNELPKVEEPSRPMSKFRKYRV